MTRKLRIEELNRITVPEFKKAGKAPLVVILDNIRSLNNIGSVFRTADAYRVQAIHLCGITATPPHRDIQKTALGATESVEWQYFENVKDSIRILKQSGFGIYAVEQTEKNISLNDFQIGSTARTAIILGNEVSGVSNEAIEMCDACIELPQYGTKHSLNVSVCSGIVIWEIFNKMKNAGLLDFA